MLIVQLWMIGAILGLLIAALLHPAFWILVARHWPWVVSLVFVSLWHVLTQLLLNRKLSDGKVVRRPYGFICAYLLFSATYVVVRPRQSSLPPLSLPTSKTHS
jgi:hypothetical protein